MDCMVKVAYVVNNAPHVGHWTWVMILRRLFNNDFYLVSLNRPKPMINGIVITEGVRPTLYGLMMKPLNKCLAAIALSPSIMSNHINKLYSEVDVGIAVSSIVEGLMASRRKVIIYPRPPELEHLLRMSVNVDDRKPWICYSGPLIPIKGIHLIPEVAKYVVKYTRETKFIIIGDGARDLITRRARKYGIKDSITITGYIPRAEVFKLLRRCSIYMQLSLFDAFPIAVIEAMALGCVPVVTKYVGSRDMVIKVSKNLIHEYDPERIAQGMVEILSNKDLLRELSPASRQVVGEELSVRRVEERIIKVLEECIG